MKIACLKDDMENSDRSLLESTAGHALIRALTLPDLKVRGFLVRRHTLVMLPVVLLEYSITRTDS